MIRHVFLTRYNLPSVGHESYVRAKEGWLRERTELFDSVTVPSMRAQRGPRPSWVVYLDPDSPPWLSSYMEARASEGLLTPIRRYQVSDDERAEDVRGVLGDGAGRLVTTNLDNDDAVASDFSVRLVERAERTVGRAALFFTHGLIMSQDRVYLRRDRHNAFCSVVEDADAPVTCWVDWHNRLPLHMPVELLGGQPGWLQVVHGSNVSNRVRGRQVSPAPYRGIFPGLRALEPPAPRELAVDWALRAPVRASRDAIRTMARAGAVRVMGPERFDNAKGAVAALVARRTRR